MSSQYLTARRQFDVDPQQDNVIALVEANKQLLEAEAQQELYDRLGNTLADFQTWPSWTVEKAKDSHMNVYTLSMKVVFKP